MKTKIIKALRATYALILAFVRVWVEDFNRPYESPQHKNIRVNLMLVDAKGCLTEQECRQLMESGVNILKMLAIHYHLKYGRPITMDEVKRMIKERKVTSAEVRIVMDRYQTYTGINLID